MQIPGRSAGPTSTVSEKAMTVSTLLSWTLPFLVLLLGGMVLRLYLQQRAYRKQSQKIKGLQNKIKAVLDESSISFDVSLQKSLRLTRETVHPGKPELLIRGNTVQDAPEKYRILTNMVARGMSAEEIATILGISTTEAGQLVTLSNMAGWNS